MGNIFNQSKEEKEFWGSDYYWTRRNWKILILLGVFSIALIAISQNASNKNITGEIISNPELKSLEKTKENPQTILKEKKESKEENKILEKEKLEANEDYNAPSVPSVSIKKDAKDTENIENTQILDSEECNENIDYLYKEYNDYQSLASRELEEILNIGEFEKGIYYSDRNNYFGSYGGKEKRKCGKIYFLLYRHGEWDSTRYWAVEMDAENGGLLKWKEITLNENKIDYSKIWW